MDQDLQAPLINFDEMKREIAEAIRSVIRERAGELGINYEACIDLLVPGKGRTSDHSTARAD
jgi:hypothetical protein